MFGETSLLTGLLFVLFWVTVSGHRRFGLKRRRDSTCFEICGWCAFQAVSRSRFVVACGGVRFKTPMMTRSFHCDSRARSGHAPGTKGCDRPVFQSPSRSTRLHRTRVSTRPGQLVRRGSSSAVHCWRFPRIHSQSSSPRLTPAAVHAGHARARAFGVLKWQEKRQTMARTRPCGASRRTRNWRGYRYVFVAAALPLFFRCSC